MLAATHQQKTLENKTIAILLNTSKKNSDNILVRFTFYVVLLAITGIPKPRPVFLQV